MCNVLDTNFHLASWNGSRYVTTTFPFSTELKNMPTGRPISAIFCAKRAKNFANKSILLILLAPINVLVCHKYNGTRRQCGKVILDYFESKFGI